MRGRTGSRIVAAAAGGLVILGLGIAAVDRLLNPSRVGPVSAAALAMPEDTRVLLGVDVGKLRDSPLLDSLSGFLEEWLKGDHGRLLSELGIDPLESVDEVVVGLRPVPGGTGLLAVARGRFDLQALGKLADGAAAAGLERRDTQGAALHLVTRAGAEPAAALAFLDGADAVIGAPEDVAALIGNRARGLEPLRSSPGLVAMLQAIEPGAQLWAVDGDGAALEQLRPYTRRLPFPALPEIDGLAAWGATAPVLALDVIARARDPEGARSLADTLGGVLTLARLQSGIFPELAEVASTASVAVDGRDVRLGIRIRKQVLDALLARLERAGGDQ
jgi:hypothetical protein